MIKLRYKEGQKVVVGKLQEPLPFNEKVKANDVVEITDLCCNGRQDQHYSVETESGFIWWLNEKEINHKATSALSNDKAN